MWWSCSYQLELCFLMSNTSSIAQACFLCILAFDLLVSFCPENPFLLVFGSWEGYISQHVYNTAENKSTSLDIGFFWSSLNYLKCLQLTVKVSRWCVVDLSAFSHQRTAKGNMVVMGFWIDFSGNHFTHSSFTWTAKDIAHVSSSMMLTWFVFNS